MWLRIHQLTVNLVVGAKRRPCNDSHTLVASRSSPGKNDATQLAWLLLQYVVPCWTPVFRKSVEFGIIRNAHCLTEVLFDRHTTHLLCDKNPKFIHKSDPCRLGDRWVPCIQFSEVKFILNHVLSCNQCGPT